MPSFETVADLPSDVSVETREGFTLSRSVHSFINRQHQTEDSALLAAFNAIDQALVATLGYMRTREEGGNPDGETERRLSNLWRTAGGIVAPIDGDLAQACYMKGLGWTAPDVWLRAREQGIKIGIPDMEGAQAELNRKRQVIREKIRAQLPSWFSYAGVSFCAVTVLFLMYWILFGPPFDPQKKVAFEFLMAFCAAGSISYFGGEAAVRGSVPFFQNSPIQFSATAGIATLIIVFLVLHYAT